MTIKRFLVAVFLMTVIYAMPVFAATPTLEIEKSEKTATITINNAPSDVNAVQLEIATSNITTGYKLSANNNGNYAIIKEKQNNNSLILTIYVDGISVNNGTIKLGTITCPDNNDFKTTADMILLNKDLSPKEYKGISIKGEKLKENIVEKTTEIATEKITETTTKGTAIKEPTMPKNPVQTIYYNVSLDCSEGGGISPNSSVKMVKGNSKTFNFSPYEGYKIADVIVNKQSIGAVNSYTVDKINDNVLIYVKFEAIQDKGNDTIKTDTSKQQSITKAIFNDMEDHWSNPAVNTLYSMGIVKGKENNCFFPDKSVTRAEFVTMLANLDGIDTAKYTNSPFGDVDYDDWFMPYVEWARTNNIVSGINENVFAPKKNITREQMAFILSNFAKYKEYTLPQKNKKVTFTDDEDIRSFSYKAVEEMQRAGIINGRGDGKFLPENNATRAEASQMLYSITILNK